MAIFNTDGIVLAITAPVQISSKVKTQTIFIKEPEELYDDMRLKKSAITYQVHVYNRRCRMLDEIKPGNQVAIQAYVESKSAKPDEQESDIKKKLAGLLAKGKWQAYNNLLGKSLDNKETTNSSNEDSYLKFYTKLNLKSISSYGQVPEDVLQSEILSSKIGIEFLSFFDPQERKPFDRITRFLNRTISKWS
ncbi:MAG: hypothetical protein K9H64_22490 [Bacteroidales bacterium]|nr:hypothetical protein [Bacteroidales bacterium]MCF8458808.1 hypothetical protein [Bacteroidales bacterium]